MSTKEEVKQKVKTSYKYAHVTRRYLRRNYQKVLEMQRRYREAHPEKSREWRREAQRRFYLKNKDKPEYQATKYYSNQKSSFKRYVLNHAEQGELNLFLSILEAKKKNEAVKRPVLITLDDKEVQKSIDEVNEELNGNGRILVRPSGTEPLLRVMAEAETDEICERLVGKVADIIRRKYGA